MAISEKLELLGKGIYETIPDVITLKAMPTITELDYVGAEDFDEVMLDKIIPQSVEGSDKMNFRELKEADYYWICRAMRILNYGPYFTTNSIYCGDCGEVSRGEYSVDLRTIDCKPMESDFIDDIVIDKDEFLDFGRSVHLRLLTVQDKMNIPKDKAFQGSGGRLNRELARICYSITSIGVERGITPPQARIIIQKEMTPADYVILKSRVADLTDYGVRAGGKCGCPACKSGDASFFCMMDDRFFRPTVGDLRRWRNDNVRGEDNTSK